MGLVLLAGAAEKGLRFGVILTALGLGFRHGIDWDHIAAITDITSSQDDRRAALMFGTLYALGHASVVFGLGILAIALGLELPDSVDATMTRIVGATLLLLGVYVFASLIRHGRDFRLRSRWMLVFAGVRKATRWSRAKLQNRPSQRALVAPSGEPMGPADEASGNLPGADLAPASSWHHGHHGRPGHHHHEQAEPESAFMNYGKATSWVVGMIHGIGAETASQLLIFLTVAGLGGAVSGALVLGAFILG